MPVKKRLIDSQIAIADVIRERGPLTVAAFMDLALYDPELGYYARAAQRSGRAGDFFTSVDVGPLFGELLEVQLAEMRISDCQTSDFEAFDLVEAGAGNGRLSADILRAAKAAPPRLLRRASACTWSKPAPRRARAQRGDARRRRRSSRVLRRRAAGVVRRRADRQRAARRAAGPSGRDARRRPARGLRHVDRRRRRRRRRLTDRSKARPRRQRSPRISTRLGVDARARLARRRSTCARWTGSATPRGGCGAASSS